MSFGSKILNETKKVAFKPVNMVNNATRTMIELLDPQNQNIFDIIIYPAFPQPEKKFSKSQVTAVKNAIVDLADNVVMKLHLQSISVGLYQFEYENANEYKVIKGIQYPETITLSLLETEQGIVRQYAKRWLDSVYDIDKHVFKDDQLSSVRNATIIPYAKIGAPSSMWIHVKGMKIKSIKEFTFSQDNGEPMIIDITCKVDSVKLMGNTI